jgi:hypothetical protein
MDETARALIRAISDSLDTVQVKDIETCSLDCLADDCDLVRGSVNSDDIRCEIHHSDILLF